MPKGLTNRQRVFIEEYLRTWNASEAARRAGYKSKPNVIGSQILANPSISAEIERRLADLQMGANEVLTRLTRHARGSMGNFINPDTGEIDLEQAREAGLLDLIKSYKRVEKKMTKLVSVETTSIELYDAQNALVTLGKHLRLFVDRTELTGADGAPLTITAPDLQQAASELATWRKQQIDALSSGASAAPIQPTSSIPTA